MTTPLPYRETGAWHARDRLYTSSHTCEDATHGRECPPACRTRSATAPPTADEYVGGGASTPRIFLGVLAPTPSSPSPTPVAIMAAMRWTRGWEELDWRTVGSPPDRDWPAPLHSIDCTDTSERPKNHG